MNTFEKLVPCVYRLCVPFEDNYTSVFALDTVTGWVLFDCACAADVESVILPALSAARIRPSHIICSHAHGDHAGGLPKLAAAFPNAKIYAGSDALTQKHGLPVTVLREGYALGELQIRALAGHTEDCIGIYDTRTGTLLSADGLQLYGVSRYGTGLADAAAYRDTLTRLAADTAVRTLIASHPYVPLGYIAEGNDAVRAYAEASLAILDELVAYAAARPALSPAEIAGAYKKEFPDRPPVPAGTFSAVRK